MARVQSQDNLVLTLCSTEKENASYHQLFQDLSLYCKTESGHKVPFNFKILKFNFLMVIFKNLAFITILPVSLT